MEPREIANAANEYLRRHEAECPLPPDQCVERINLLAYIAHCIGIRATRAALEHDLREGIALYERYCEGCSHLRN